MSDLHLLKKLSLILRNLFKRVSLSFEKLG